MRLVISDPGSLLSVVLDREISEAEYAAIMDVLNPTPPRRIDPEQLTESQAIAARARGEYEAMSPEEQAKVRAAWEARSEEERQDIRDAVEFDLL